MPNGGDVSAEQFREWKEAFAPYVDAVEQFIRKRGLRVDKWYHDFPGWFIGRDQKLDDLDVVWWNIQLGYSEEKQRFGLNAAAWLDKKYSVPEGLVSERRLVDNPDRIKVASWNRGEQINIETLLEEAYQRATSFTKEDLTQVSAYIKGSDGITRSYNPQPLCVEDS